jgi:hypothetical protein
MLLITWDLRDFCDVRMNSSTGFYVTCFVGGTGKKKGAVTTTK